MVNLLVRQFKFVLYDGGSYAMFVILTSCCCGKDGLVYKVCGSDMIFERISVCVNCIYLHAACMETVHQLSSNLDYNSALSP